MESIIQVDHLAKTYQTASDPAHAVRDVSFSVNKGEIFGILGPNGAGKTTTLEILEGLKEPSGGKASLFNLDIIADTDAIKKRIGVQLQSSDYFPLITLAELLELFASFYTTKVNPAELLSLVGLEDKAGVYINQLSGGQKQRFTIATSLVNNPEILFLDEPTTGLDPKARRDLWGLIKQLHRRGITIVITTHYMEEAEYLCDRVAIFDHGTVLRIASPKELIQELSHTTQLSFFSDTDVKPEWFSGVVSIEKMYHKSPKIIFELTSLEEISKIVEILKEKSVAFSGFAVRTASLEDVYLDLTGKEFEI